MLGSSNSRRPAFTLVELLVVIAIIGVLIALLLPAVQAARESARRTKCINNLKQLGLGLHNHHDTMKEFPASREVIPDPAGGPNMVHCWTARVLPYIEQQNLHARYRFDEDWDGPNNDAANGPIKQSLPVFLCPSAPQQGVRAGNNRGSLDYPATTERTWPNPWVSAQQALFVQQADPQFIGVLGESDLVSGVMRPPHRTFASITDGSSNTFMLAECGGRNQRFIQGKQVTGAWTGGPWANPNGRINIGGFNPAIPTDPIGPCAVNCINDKEIYAFHPGIANALMCDGSVRPISAQTRLDVVLQLLTRARGEVITNMP